MQDKISLSNALLPLDWLVNYCSAKVIALILSYPPVPAMTQSFFWTFFSLNSKINRNHYITKACTGYSGLFDTKINYSDLEYRANEERTNNIMEYTFRPQGVCSRQIDFELDGDIVKNVRFTGGCSGNLQAISKLIEGENVDKIISTLEGNTCGFKQTSCADQLTIALRQAKESC